MGKKYLFFGNFGVLCFLETPVLRFALLPYYRRTLKDRLQHMRRAIIRARLHALLHARLKLQRRAIWHTSYIVSQTCDDLNITKQQANEILSSTLLFTSTKWNQSFFFEKHLDKLQKMVENSMKTFSNSILDFLLWHNVWIIISFYFICTNKTRLLTSVKQLNIETGDFRLGHVDLCLNTFTSCLTCSLYFSVYILRFLFSSFRSFWCV